MSPEEIISQKFSLKNIRKKERELELKKFLKKMKKEVGATSTPKGRKEIEKKANERIIIIGIREIRKEVEEKERKRNLVLMKKRAELLVKEKRSKLELAKAELELARVKFINWKEEREEKMREMLPEKENNLVHELHDQLTKELNEDPTFYPGLDYIKLLVENSLAERRRETSPMEELINKWQEDVEVKLEDIKDKIQKI